MLPPVTRLCVVNVDLTNGTSFQIVHDLKPTGGNKSFEGAFNQWMTKTLKYTPESLIKFIKNRQPDCICILKSEYDKIASLPGVILATKEEYDAENN